MNRTLARAIASLLVLIVSFATAPLVRAQDQAASTPAQAAQAPNSTVQPAQPGQESSQPTPQETTPSSHQPPVELPENPGQSEQQQPAPSTAPATSQPTQQTPEPNGTAVAPQVGTSGGAASKPAGVAIAPPKQRRVRSLLIKLGVLAGAGIAIGTVAGLSAASPSHVPNSPGH
jgi:outer membrane biosynthesis protein TonB